MPKKSLAALALVVWVAGCAATGSGSLPMLPQQQGAQGLIPPDYVCPGSIPGPPDQMLLAEIRAFLEENGMLGRLPGGMTADIPLVLNGPVKSYLIAFAKSPNFRASLARSKRYLPMIRQVFRRQGLPQDLIYLPLIESGFNPKARSPKEAVGMWQFVAETARRYGLKVNEKVDERCDPEKSTLAAARYLEDLYHQFGCWYLAAAGYNAGEKRVEGVVSRHGTRDFWTMAQGRLLPQETCNYVPQLIAATLIAKSPKKYGLVPQQEPEKAVAASE
ncbi:MAG: lytic transglycosylase domain-containing protein [Thermodesulfobacteriota bacterium]